MLPWKIKKVNEYHTVLHKKKISLNTHVHTHSKVIKENNAMYAFKWYLYGFLYNTTFSENIHLDIIQVQMYKIFKLILFSLIIIHFCYNS